MAVRDMRFHILHLSVVWRNVTTQPGPIAAPRDWTPSARCWSCILLRGDRLLWASVGLAQDTNSIDASRGPGRTKRRTLSRMSRQKWLRWNVTALSFVALLASACSPTTPSSTSDCVSKGSVSAQIDGVAWSAACVNSAKSVDLRYVEVLGNTLDGTQRMTFRVYATQPGTYLLGGPELAPVGMGSSASLNLGCQRPGSCPAWIVAPCCGQPGGNGSGTIVITDMTATSASGTFSFDLVANSGTGATGARVVTNGRFNVIF